jgi:uncharacterized protein (TIGR00725 family)
MKKKFQVGVVGFAGQEEYPAEAKPDPKIYKIAEEIGFLLAKENFIVVTGGKGGVMESAAKGAEKAGGISLGVISGGKRFTSNKYTNVEILTGSVVSGLDEYSLVNMCDALVVVGGGAGTLQEITIAYRNRKPIIIMEKTGGITGLLPKDYLDARALVGFQWAKEPAQALAKLKNSVLLNLSAGVKCAAHQANPF